MTREEVIKVIKTFGFKQWGTLRRYRGSSYQCFRKGSHYAWVGLRYLELDTEAEALDFVGNHSEYVIGFIRIACRRHLSK